jgi:hypothetical protein
MATEVAVAPTLGHAVLYTQGGVGATPGYDAIDLRRSIEAASAIQEGVMDATGWKVRERAAGANMTVEVDANVGLAVVQGDSVTHQSRYVVAPHSAVVALDIAAAHSTNPRVDMVVLQIRDNTHDALGQSDARVMVLTGTPTAGATIDNLNGQASLPANALRLADVHVPAADTTIANAQIRDRRKWARAAFVEITRTANAAAGNNYVLASGAPTLIDATNMQPRIECSGAPMRMKLSSGMTHTTSGGASRATFWVGLDGTAISGTARIIDMPSAGGNLPIDLEMWFTPSAGSHLIGPMAQSAATASLLTQASFATYLTIEEADRPNARNS